MRKILLVSALLAATLSLAAPMRAVADDDGYGPGMMMGHGCGMMGSGMGFGHMMGRHGWRMGAQVDGQLAFLKSELEITAAQADAWKDYAEAVTGRVTAMQAARQTVREAMEKGGALERMDARISGMDAMLQSLKSIRPAVEKLYNALDSDQKKLADDLIGAQCGAM